jgi:hypothetical protein
LIGSIDEELPKNIKPFNKTKRNKNDYYLKGMNWKTKETFKEWFKRMKDIDSYLIKQKGNND